MINLSTANLIGGSLWEPTVANGTWNNLGGSLLDDRIDVSMVNSSYGTFNNNAGATFRKSGGKPGPPLPPS